MAALLDQLRQLRSDLTSMMSTDSEQEVTGTAFQTLERVLTEARAALPAESTVRDQVPELFSVDFIAAGEPIRAADALILVGQLLAALEFYSQHDDRGTPVYLISEDELPPDSPFRRG